MKSVASVALSLLSVSVIVAAAPAEKRQLAQVFTKCTVPNTAALTFDDGPWTYTHDVVNTLKAAGAVGTFFVNGKLYGCIYDGAGERVKYIYSQGMQVASHTWSHPHMNSLSQANIDSELTRVNQAIQRLTGAVPAFVRPPYGEYNDLFRQVAASKGQKLVTWDFDSGDSTGSTAAQSKAKYTTLANAKPSTILTLNHETQSTTAYDVLPHAISVLKAKGYRLVSVAECLGLPAYQSTGAPQSGTWTC